jgi:hypothetical protein
MIGDPVPPLRDQIDGAFEDASGGSVFLVASLSSDALGGGPRRRVTRVRDSDSLPGAFLRRLPPGFEVTESETFRGLGSLVVFTIEDRGQRR